MNHHHLDNSNDDVSRRYKIGVIGGGFVGKATAGFQNSKDNVIIFDLNSSLSRPCTTTMEDIYECHLVFVCVPTPMSKDGSCHISIVESVVKDLKQNGVKHIIIRSTVPIGTSELLETHFMPEFLTEKNWAHDFKTCGKWVLGINTKCKDSEECKTILQRTIENCVDEGVLDNKDVAFISTKEAELLKYFRNCFLATKVGFCNEIYHLCERVGISYDVMCEHAASDSRIGSSHTGVPGHDGKLGFGGTCFPKDLSSLIHQFSSHGVKSPILNAVQDRNVHIDRPEQDWNSDKGRAVVG
jgi:UDPglucose 6-dehydrogenase